MNKLIFISLILLGIVSCKRFDSDSFNKKLIQGEWIQVEVFSTISDTLHLGQNTEKETTLTFRGDSCFEKINGQESYKHFVFYIRNYYIYAEEKETPANFLRINKLTEDSLILRTKDRILRYSRKTL